MMAAFKGSLQWLVVNKQLCQHCLTLVGLGLLGLNIKVVVCTQANILYKCEIVLSLCSFVQRQLKVCQSTTPKNPNLISSASYDHLTKYFSSDFAWMHTVTVTLLCTLSLSYQKYANLQLNM